MAVQIDVYDVINQKECGVCLTTRPDPICWDMFMPREQDSKEMPYLVWKYVGLKFSQETGKHFICADCGKALHEFNRFYLWVHDAHLQRLAKVELAQVNPDQPYHENVNQNGACGTEQVQFKEDPAVDADLSHAVEQRVELKQEVSAENGFTPVPTLHPTEGGNGPTEYEREPHRMSAIGSANETEAESSQVRPIVGTPSRKRRNQEIDDEILEFYKLVCDVCDDRSEYGSMKELNQHMRQQHGEESGRVGCPQCGKKFRTRVKLLEHKHVHTRQAEAAEDEVERVQSDQMDKEILEFYKRIVCDVCETAGTTQSGTLYGTVKELNHHMRLEHGQPAGAVKCPICEKKIRTRPKLLEHKRMHLSNELMEDDSGKSGTAGNETGPELTEEQKQTLDREIFDFYKPIVCEICDPEKAPPGETTVEYRSLKLLNQHMRATHGLDSGTVKCQICAKKFRTRVKLVEHKDMHENPERYRCSTCQEVHQNLEEHMQNKHQEWEFKCEECGKRFPFKSRLTAHMGKVHLKKDIICEECNKPFTKFSIEKHKRAVHGATFTCENCPKTFKTRFSLERHMEGHNVEQQGPATVSCTLCNSVLKDEYNLKTHMKRIHAEQTPATCKTCGKTFKSKHSLYTHISNVCTTRQFPCTVCGKQFKKRTKLKQHMTTHARSAD
ncbi:zinc finger protein 721-like [Anopheles ziemanni]|uniref:zinc finger protein 721-like n=1 Tax=Anopheles coustani TaxID=139045 RepID=UPI00265A0668|nr:zinc finger protein 721-like [Anopheles coustani]XP_058170059.1 zinc finger protein 721-like [Anopheles ziemanni]